jgi:Holliday junction resolvase RusA-like endonuclease
MSFNTIDFPCEIDILFGRKNNRKWDLTNKAESVMDLLVDCKVLKDDNYTIASKITLSSVKSDTDFVNIKISKYQK